MRLQRRPLPSTAYSLRGEADDDFAWKASRLTAGDRAIARLPTRVPLGKHRPGPPFGTPRHAETLPAAQRTSPTCPFYGQVDWICKHSPTSRSVFLLGPS